MTEHPLLEAVELVKTYRKRRVVDDVDVEVFPQEIVGLLGPNGAGKTTTFRMVVGMVRPEHGAIYFDGEDITRLPMYKRARLGMGYLPQTKSVFRGMSVEDNILAVLETMRMRTQGAQTPTRGTDRLLRVTSHPEVERRRDLRW